MKKLYTPSFAFLLLLISVRSFASLEIFCPKDKDITYDQYVKGNYYDKPTVWGVCTIYGPWIKSNLNCGNGYVEVKWEIDDDHNRAYWCTQTIWVTNSYGGKSISVWCPNDQTVYCDELDYVKYNKPEVTGGSDYSLYGPYISKSLNDCGVGSIWVEWKVIDGCGNKYYCKSAIWVKARKSSPSIWWPKDFEADACKDNVDPKYLAYPYGYPEINSYNSCAHYGISYKDEEFTFPNTPGLCKKIVRTWSVIDWCNYNPNGYGDYNDYGGKWTHVQLIKLISKSKPAINCKATILVEQESYGCTGWVDVPIPTITSSCNGKTTINHNSKFATKPGADASGQYPFGSTDVTFRVTDECGNYSECITTIIVKDKTRPTPYCYPSVIVGISTNSDGVYTIINPKMWDAGSYDNCTPKNKLKFSAEPTKMTCDSLGIRKLKIFVEDESGNKDFCSVTINLQDNTGMCPKKSSPPIVTTTPPSGRDSITIAGLLVSPDYSPIDSVSIHIVDTNGNKSKMANGKYLFSNLRKNNDYMLRPFKRDDYLKGVTTEDYELLINYIQGKDTLPGPLALLAADIDGNDTINMEDAFLLGYYLLTHAKTIADTIPSWRFLPMDYDVMNLAASRYKLNAWPDYIRLRNLDTSYLTADFIGVKVGDINLSLFKEDSIANLAHLEIRESESQPTIQVKAYPNPFIDQTTFLLHSSSEQTIEFKIFDLMGRALVVKHVSLLAGPNQLAVSATDLNDNSGIYLFQFSSRSQNLTGKIQLVK